MNLEVCCFGDKKREKRNRKVWLNLFNTELSPKRYWRGLRSQKAVENGDCTYHYTIITTRMTPALRWTA